MKQSNPNRTPTYLVLDSQTKDTLKALADYKHTSLTNTIEEASRMYIHRERQRILEDQYDMDTLNRVISSKLSHQEAV